MEANVGDRSVGAESGRTCRHREPVLRQCYCNSNHTNTVISKGCHIPTELTAQYSSPFLGFVAVGCKTSEICNEWPACAKPNSSQPQSIHLPAIFKILTENTLSNFYAMQYIYVLISTNSWLI